MRNPSIVAALTAPYRKATIPTVGATGALQSVDNRGWFRILESFTGAWQTNTEVSLANVTTHPTLFACVTLIAATVSKMRMRLVEERAGIWQEVDVPAFSPVLRRPNHFQIPQQFFEYWLLSKLLTGNTYVLKVRDNRGTVTAMYTLDPNRVRPLVSPSGEVFYQLSRDDLSQLQKPEGYVVPASEIIHDRFNCLFHPLIGLSPIYASGVAAVQGLNIQTNQTNFFGNGSRPGGVLTAPGVISQPTADRLKAYFDEHFTGENAGKVAVLGDGLKYEAMSMNAVDSELIKQLGWTDEKIASTFHVPLFMVSSATYPPYNSVVSLVTMFYAMCIQGLAEPLETCLDRGLGIGLEGDTRKYGTEFNTDDLFTMDLSSLMEMLERGRNYLTPNEGRRRANLPPTLGGDVVYRQQQDFSLEALAKRDAREDPFASAAPPPPSPAEDPDDEPDDEPETDEAKALVLRYRAMEMATRFIDEVAA